MSKKTETVKDVCDEMELVSGDETVDEIVVKKEDWIALANRILSAHNREIADKDAEIAFLKRGIDKMDTNCNRLKERIALLEKALKPVIEINLEGLTEFEGIDYEELVTAIVADAQHIMKEGEAK